MKLAIMQPYFLPYIGYWQLMQYADTFVVYDNIEYTKKGWINRNRYLCNGEDKYFTLPLRKDSDFLDVDKRYISSDFDRNKLKNQIAAAYGKAPYFKNIFPVFEKILDNKQDNLFNYLFDSIREIKDLLGIKTQLVISSTLSVEEGLRGKERVQGICKALCADEYINPIGGVKLYDKQDFAEQGIKLSFLESDFERICYKQFAYPFVPALSILDTLMFVSLAETKDLLRMYKIQ